MKEPTMPAPDLGRLSPGNSLPEPLYFRRDLPVSVLASLAALCAASPIPQPSAPQETHP